VFQAKILFAVWKPSIRI